MDEECLTEVNLKRKLIVVVHQLLIHFEARLNVSLQRWITELHVALLRIGDQPIEVLPLWFEWRCDTFDSDGASIPLILNQIWRLVEANLLERKCQLISRLTNTAITAAYVGSFHEEDLTSAWLAVKESCVLHLLAPFIKAITGCFAELSLSIRCLKLDLAKVVFICGLVL